MLRYCNCQPFYCNLNRQIIAPVCLHSGILYKVYFKMFKKLSIEKSYLRKRLKLGWSFYILMKPNRVCIFSQTMGLRKVWGISSLQTYPGFISCTPALPVWPCKIIVRLGLWGKHRYLNFALEKDSCPFVSRSTMLFFCWVFIISWGAYWSENAQI